MTVGADSSKSGRGLPETVAVGLAHARSVVATLIPWLRSPIEPVLPIESGQTDDADGVRGIGVARVVDELDLGPVRHDVVRAVGLILADDRGRAIRVRVALLRIPVPGVLLGVHRGLVAPDEPVRRQGQLQLVRVTARHAWCPSWNG